MNILYINHYAGSPEMGMEFRPYYLSREWVKMGHKVTIIAGNFSHLRQKNPAVDHDFQEEWIDGINYVWIKSGEYEGNGVKRAFSMFRFVGKLWFHAEEIAKRYKPDVVIASSTYPLDTYAVQKIAKLAKAKYIHEVHDMWPATLYEVGGMSKSHPFVELMQVAEDSAYKHCDKCVSLLPYAKGYMVQHGLNPEKFINIQNGVVKEEWENIEMLPVQHKCFFEEHEGSFVVGYFGGHAISNGLDNILDLAKCFIADKSKEKVIFVLVGNGVEKERLIKRATEENLINVYFLPSVSKKTIPELVKHFDCSFMTGISSPLYRFGLCLNKMYDSMMAGLPIICAFDAPETLVKKYHCGYQCRPEEKNEIVSAIKELASMPVAKRKQMGMNGKKTILEHFTYNILAKEFFEKAMEGRSKNL